LLQGLSAFAIGGAFTTSYAGPNAAFPLWEVRHKGKRAFLLAHTPPRSVAWKDERAERLLTECGHYWNETGHHSEANIQDLMQQYGIDHAQTLESHLDDVQRARLSEAATAVGVARESLSAFCPWLAGQTLEEALFSAAGFDKPNADSVLAAQALARSIPASSEFPTIDSVARWFAKLPAEAEVQYLEYIIDEVLLGQEKGQQIYTQWTEGTETLAVAWVARMRQRYPRLYDAIVLERNMGWVPRVRIMLEAEKPSMIVVGFYHMVGPDRIQLQLARAGFAVERI
jgi:uncharacterized protein YbaP (TraB family)